MRAYLHAEQSHFLIDPHHSSVERVGRQIAHGNVAQRDGHLCRPGVHVQLHSQAFDGHLSNVVFLRTGAHQEGLQHRLHNQLADFLTFDHHLFRRLRNETEAVGASGEGRRGEVPGGKEGMAQ